MAKSTKIEFARLSDASRISNLSHKHIEYGLRRRYTPSRVRSLIRNPASNVIVARADRVLVGFGIMTYLENSANLDLLAVTKSCRRRGVGADILRWLEKVARTAGIANVFVQVRNTNAGGIRFYQKLGFQVVDEVVGYYQGRESALILCKALRPIVGADDRESLPYRFSTRLA